MLIPRSFHGTIKLSSTGYCVVSKEIYKNGALLSAVNGRKMTYFVGNFLPIMSGSGTRSVKQALDKLKVEAGDKGIILKYVDEPVVVPEWSRLFHNQES